MQCVFEDVFSEIQLKFQNVPCSGFRQCEMFLVKYIYVSLFVISTTFMIFGRYYNIKKKKRHFMANLCFLLVNTYF